MKHLTILILAMLVNGNALIAQDIKLKNPIDKEIFDQTRRSVAEVFYNNGYKLYAKGNLQKAMAEFFLAIKTDSLYAEPNEKLGLIFLQQGDTENATKHLTRAIALNHYQSGIFYFLLKEYDKAREFLLTAKDAGITIPQKVIDELKM